MRFDVHRFVADLGGPRKAAAVSGVSRTTPYRWLKVGRISTQVLQRVMASHPEIDLNSYFKEGV